MPAMTQLKMLMKPLLLFFFLNVVILHAQNPADTLKPVQNISNADDPANFITRFETYNELQYYNEKDFYFNQTILRSIVGIGKRFSTRLDVPIVYNSINASPDLKQSGLGDISFRVLGYKFLENPKSAITASLEISLNTAESRLLGTGKNLLIPLITYTFAIPKQKMFCAIVFQQANSIGGDVERSDVSFSKLQLILLKRWSPKFWTVLAPEWYLDYINGGLSMNLRSRLTYVPTPRLNIWITPSAGIFGDFVGRYQWSLDVGGRYFLFRKKGR